MDPIQAYNQQWAAIVRDIMDPQPPQQPDLIRVAPDTRREISNLWQRKYELEAELAELNHKIRCMEEGGDTEV